MKKITLIACLLISTFIIYSCKKNKSVALSGSTPVSFTATAYTFLGAFDDTGRPVNLVSPSDVISVGFQSFLKGIIPENTDLRKTHPEYLTGNGNNDLIINSKSDVYITFASEGTGNTNSIGYYTYPTGNPPLKAVDITNIIYIFPNASITGGSGTLNPGDKVKIGTFNAGISIGFVLLKNGWDTANKKVYTSAVHFCSNENLNPENDPSLKRHTVLINYSAENKTVIGFEDIDRTDPQCDNDFNDVVLYATVNPS